MYVPTWKSYAPASLQVASFYCNQIHHHNQNNSIIMKRSELAMIYFPMKSEAEARRMLSRWIYRCPELVDELKKISPYFYKKKELSKQEVKLIIQYLGDP